MENTIYKYRKVTKGPMMNNRGEILWAVYVDGQFIDVFDNGISAEKFRKELDDRHNKPQYDNSLPNKNTKTSITFL